jgi:hypothetical protein
VYLKTYQEDSPMKKIIGYLIAFIIGWSGAVWSYADLIYTKN